jgi:hypothetical protein
VPNEVERDAPTQRNRRDRPERIPDVSQGLLDAEGGKDYPCNHRQVQQAVGVSRQPCPLLSLRRREPPLGIQRDEVEVRSPQGCGERDPENDGDEYSYPERQPRGPDAGRHDRLAQGYDDYEAVALHEVPSVDPEA